MAQQLIPRSAAELFAHAIAMEREAQSRYRQFAEWMLDLGIASVARLFQKLERSGRLEMLESEAADLELPEISPWEYAWFFTASPAYMEVSFPLMPQTPRDALALACAAEHRVEEFFLLAANGMRDAEGVKLAVEMALAAHRRVAELERALRREPDPRLDWEGVYQSGIELRPARGESHAA
ncbi:MAG TPA: ferritin family protein [Burkholderiales bacterium]|nr:ferritin family protein [Burkholderiales bacterium]